MTVEGVDVSSAQTVPFWEKVPADIEFCFIRATHGHQRDLRFTVHWNAAVNAARPCGGYSFDEPGDIAEAVAAFCDSDAMNMVLPPVLDAEALQGRTPEQFVKDARAWLDGVEKRCGRTPILYTGMGVWSQLGALGKTPDWKRYPLFCAQYGVTKPTLFGPWDTWMFHQYAANTIAKLPDGRTVWGKAASDALANVKGTKLLASPGIVPGIAGEVDRDRFNGTTRQLLDLAGMP